MGKKIVISIITLIFIVVILFGIWKIRNNSVTENNNSNNVEITNVVDLSQEYVTDDCLDEWNDYNNIANQDIESASNDMVNQNTHYLAKNVNGYIYIYCLNDMNEEILYKKTDISTQYLSAKDLDDLEIGIEVVGSKELNELLENFE